jgi:hypothetical protein
VLRLPVINLNISFALKKPAATTRPSTGVGGAGEWKKLLIGKLRTWGKINYDFQERHNNNVEK